MNLESAQRFHLSALVSGFLALVVSVLALRILPHSAYFFSPMGVHDFAQSAGVFGTILDCSDELSKAYHCYCCSTEAIWTDETFIGWNVCNTAVNEMLSVPHWSISDQRGVSGGCFPFVRGA